MYKKWKSIAALSMAALLGCMMPMGTMLAAEGDTENVQEIDEDSASDTDNVYGGESNIDEDENACDEANAENAHAGGDAGADDENPDDEINAVADVDNAVTAYEESVNDEADTYNDADEGVGDIPETGVSETGDSENSESLPAPVINITFNGQSCKVDGLGGKIDYIYVNNSNQMLEFSASQGEKNLTIYYYLDEFDDMTDSAKEEEQLTWEGPSSSMAYVLSHDKKYVLYARAKGTDGQITYARSCGIVVDTIAPEIVGIVEGNTYPEGTAFKVNDANLESVKVNETIVTPESDGSYLVSANGTSCVIRAKDKAGNEKICSITVTAKNPAEDGVISENGTYTLQAGTSYKLAEGKWQVDGDSTIYQGGSAFYVKTDGDYSFTKR